MGIVSLSALLFFGIIVGIFVGINADEKEKLTSYLAGLSIDEEKYTPYTYDIYLKEYEEVQTIVKITALKLSKSSRKSSENLRKWSKAKNGLIQPRK